MKMEHTQCSETSAIKHKHNKVIFKLQEFFIQNKITSIDNSKRELYKIGFKTKTCAFLWIFITPIVS
jgi:hypothetical protein